MNTWDKVYYEKQMAQYPDNALIRFVAKYYYAAPDRKEVKFLDIGCGAGSSTWFLSREGFSVAAIDSSLVAIERLRQRLKKENLEAFTGCLDITTLDFKENCFDAIVDVSSTCYVPQDKIEGLMKNLLRVLKSGGRYFQITPASTCARNPFNQVIEGIEFEARFLTLDEVYFNFKDFSNVQVTSYSYNVSNIDGKVKLWVIEATK